MMANVVCVNARLNPCRAVAFSFVLLAIQGCEKEAAREAMKAPLPVTVMTLAETTPQSSYAASGSVKSWKT